MSESCKMFRYKYQEPILKLSTGLDIYLKIILCEGYIIANCPQIIFLVSHCKVCLMPISKPQKTEPRRNIPFVLQIFFEILNI